MRESECVPDYVERLVQYI